MFHVVDRLGDEVSHMVVVQRVNDAVAVAPPGDKAKMAEDPKLVRDRGRLELHIVGEIGDRALRLPQSRQDANPARRGERLHRRGDLLSEIPVDRRKRKSLAVLEMGHGPNVSEEVFRLSRSPRPHHASEPTARPRHSRATAWGSKTRSERSLRPWPGRVGFPV